MGRSVKYPNETVDERKARQRMATKQRVQKSRQRQKEMKALAAIQRAHEAEETAAGAAAAASNASSPHTTLALLDAASKASELANLTPKRNVGRLWTPHEAEALRKGVEKYGMGKWQMILRDEVFGPTLKDRSNVDLKDKWRCLMGRTHLTVAASSALVELARTPSSFSLSEMGGANNDDNDACQEASGVAAMAALACVTAAGRRATRHIPTRQHQHGNKSSRWEEEEEEEGDGGALTPPELEDPSPMPRPSKKARTGWSRGMPVSSKAAPPTAPPSPVPSAKRPAGSPQQSSDGSDGDGSGLAESADMRTGSGSGGSSGSADPHASLAKRMTSAAAARRRAEAAVAAAKTSLLAAREKLEAAAERERIVTADYEASTGKEAAKAAHAAADTALSADERTGGGGGDVGADAEVEAGPSKLCEDAQLNATLTLEALAEQAKVKVEEEQGNAEEAAQEEPRQETPKQPQKRAAASPAVVCHVRVLSPSPLGSQQAA